MNLFLFMIVSGVTLLAAYLTIGKALAKVFRLGTHDDMPSHAFRDGLDYEPLRPAALLPQHFSAIAAAGPIVGPILAAIYFGWGPAWLWIIFGSILIGGVHDLTALTASVRHGGRSVAEIVRLYMNPRAYVLFLLFIWSALVYVIIAFTDVTAGTFLTVPQPGMPLTDAPGPAVATSSILYLVLGVAMGAVLRYTKIGPGTAKAIFLPILVGAIALGPYMPLDILKFISDPGKAQAAWGYLLLAYCFVAALAPVWLLLQPRGELGGWFLYIIMAIAVLGITAGAFLSGGVVGSTDPTAAAANLNIAYPFFKGWEGKDAFGTALPLFPILFITVACGACSGFHSIVASGTTSKQLDHEGDARPVAYGGMLLEGFLACLSLATIMIVVTPEAGAKPDTIYAKGITEFASRLLAPLGLASPHLRQIVFQFGLLCFATFVFDTLDACTRLARYVLMELLGWKSRAQAWLATALSLVLPALAIALPRVMVGDKALPLWQVFWSIFGSSNQLLAALTLLGVTVWMARKGLPYWIALAPTIFMMGMTLWSLVLMVGPYVALVRSGAKIVPLQHIQFGIVVTLLALSVWLIGEAILTWRTLRRERDWADGGAVSVA